MSAAQSPPRFITQWQRALIRSSLADRAKVAGIAQAFYADFKTGEGVRVSIERLADDLGKTRPRVNEAVQILVREGWIEHVGNMPHGVRKYRLVIPDRCSDSGTGTCADSGTGDPTPGVPIFAPGVPEIAPGVPEPEHNSSDQQTVRSDDEDERARGAASADAPAAPAAVDDARTDRAVERLLRELTRGPLSPRVWRDRAIDAGAVRSAVGSLLAAGWQSWELVDHLLTIGTAKSSPTRLVVRHLAQLADRDPAGWRAEPRPCHSPGERTRRTLGDYAVIARLVARLPSAYADELDNPGGRLFRDDGRPTAEAKPALEALARAERDGYDPLRLLDAQNRYACIHCLERGETTLTWFAVKVGDQLVGCCPDDSEPAT